MVPTGSLHVFKFDVDVAADSQRQGGLAPSNHGGVDDTQRAFPHCLSGFFQKIQGDAVHRHLSHLKTTHKLGKDLFNFLGASMHCMISAFIKDYIVSQGTIFIF